MTRVLSWGRGEEWLEQFGDAGAVHEFQIVDGTLMICEGFDAGCARYSLLAQRAGGKIPGTVISIVVDMYKQRRAERLSPVACNGLRQSERAALGAEKENNTTLRVAGK
jgi:hypothetical protein